MGIVHVPPQPLSRRGQWLAGLLVLELVAIWGIGLGLFFRLPPVVPVHFTLQGEPDRYGSRIELLFLLPALSIVPVLFLAIVRWRFVLVNRFPYLINLPAFFLALPSLPPERRSAWFNRYIEAMMVFAVLTTLWLLVLEVSILTSALVHTPGSIFLLVMLVVPFALVVAFLIWLRSLDRALRAEIQHG